MNSEKLSIESLEIESFVTSLTIEEQAKQKGGTGAFCGAVATYVGGRLAEEVYEWLDEQLDGLLDEAADAAWDAFDGFMGDLLGEDLWDSIKEFFEDLWEAITY